jgi:hypothetical protein
LALDGDERLASGSGWLIPIQGISWREDWAKEERTNVCSNVVFQTASRRFPNLWPNCYIDEIFRIHSSSLSFLLLLLLLLLLNTCEHGFTKWKPTILNPVTYLDFVIPSVGTQLQASATYFDLSRTSYLAPPNPLLLKFGAFRISFGYVDWLCSYITNRQSLVRFP